jgi:hypothetical protein
MARMIRVHSAVVRDISVIRGNNPPGRRATAPAREGFNA